MRQLRQMKKVWYFVIMAAVAFILAAVALGCTKDAPKAPTPQNLTLPSNEILQWDEVEGVMEYVVRINEDYYTVTENKLDVFELTDKAGTYVISVAARASGKLQSEWSKEIKTEVPPLTGGIRAAKLMDGSGFVVEGVPEKLSGKVVVPSSVQGLPVVGFTAKGFKDCSKITSIILPDSIKTYGWTVFQGCANLRRIRLSKGAPVLDGLCECESLEIVDIPDEVEEMRNVFYGCYNLKSLRIGSGLKKFLPYGLLKDCTQLNEIIISPDNRTLRAEKNYIIRIIDDCLLLGISDGEIPSSVESIGEYAFADKRITTITIPQTIKKIYLGAFAGNDSLMNVTFEGSMEELPDNIFKECKNLEKIVLPKDLKKIGESAFYEYDELREIEIAASVNSIGVAAFGGCNKINIRIDENNEIYSDEGNCIIHKPTLTVTHVNDNSDVPLYVKIIGKMAVSALTVETYTVAEGVEEIGEQAFFRCGNLREVYLPEGLKKIGDLAFRYAGVNLTSLVMPDSVTEVGGGSLWLMTVYTSRKPYALDQSVEWTKIYAFHLKFSWNPTIWPGSSDYTVYGCDIQHDGVYPYLKSITQVGFELYDNNGESVYGTRIGYVRGVMAAPSRKGYRCIGTSFEENGKVDRGLYYFELLEPVYGYILKKGYSIFDHSASGTNIEEGQTIYMVYENNG